MTRSLHRWLGVPLALLLALVALSGAALAAFPLLESWAAPSLAGLTAADLLTTLARAHPGLVEVAVSAGGQVTAWFPEADQITSALVDPASGAVLAPATPSAALIWLENLHRSLFLNDPGRLAVAGAALAMLGLAVSGIVLLARRAGGWGALLRPMRGSGIGRWHSELARLAALGLALSALTGLWLTAASFDLLPVSDSAVFPATVSGRLGATFDQMPALTMLPASALRDLVLPRAADAQDVLTLTTSSGQGYIDQGSGALLSWAGANWADRITALMLLLHTGRGAALLGALLGLAALAVPALAATGLMQTLRRGRRTPRSVRPALAETIILVGSESGSTWGFAETLRAALAAQGDAACVLPLSDFAPQHWTRASRCLILTATYGAGTAPASASGFLDRLSALPAPPNARLAILGFGDRSFPDYCAYADQIATAAAAKGWPALLPPATVNQQSAQDFARWGQDLSAATGLALRLEHQAEALPATDLVLHSRRDYGHTLQVPTAILRFALPRRSLWQRLTGRGFPAFQPGDLLGVLPEGSAVPRFYSLASGSEDGFVEICVRKHPGGLCSGQLIALEPGQSLRGFIRVNPGFHPARDDTPLILIGAGTGVGPLAGFIRANRRRRPIRLFFGMRHADADFLYAPDLAAWQAQGRLSRLHLAFSRGPRPHYVQDALRAEAEALRQLIAQGARIMVCGGRDMANGVRAALTEVLAPTGLSPQHLLAEGRYAEDVY